MQIQCPAVNFCIIFYVFVFMSCMLRLSNLVAVTNNLDVASIYNPSVLYAFNIQIYVSQTT